MNDNQPPAPGSEGVVQPLLAALSQGQQLVALFDADDRLRHANAAFRDVFLGGDEGAFTFAEILRHAFRMRVGPKIDSGDIEAFLTMVTARRRQRSQRAFEVDLVDGRWLWVTETLLEDGWLLMVGADITRLKHNERTLRKAHEAALHASRTDPLTGLPNRRHVMELLAEGLAASAGSGRSFGLALIDIDHFKRINDTLGHDGGDRVLVHFAGAAAPLLREGDALGRFGGEEFLLVLPDRGEREVADAARRLRDRVASSGGRGGIPSYTFSAGVAVARPGEDVGSLIRRADTALYEAKDAGRDGFRLAPPAERMVRPPAVTVGEKTN